MRYFWLIVPLLMLGGCTQQGNNKRTYEDIAPIKIANSGEESWALVTITSDLTGASTQDQEMGDAQTSPVFTAAWEAAQAMGAKDGAAFMKDIAPILEKWFLDRSVDDDSTHTNGGGSSDSSERDSDRNDSGDNSVDTDPISSVVAIANCDSEMTYYGVPQKVCTFKQYDNCLDVEAESFTLIFIDSYENTRELEVSDRCSIAMGSKEEGYIKWRPEHDKEPFKPVGYAPRGFNAVEAKIVEKKDDAPDSSWHRVVWSELGCKDPDSDHDRLCWTKITGTTEKWWRKFPLPKWVDDNCEAFDFRFSSGRTFSVPNSCGMSMDSNGPKYRPEEHGESNPKKQHPKISEEYGKKEDWVEFRRVNE